MLQGARTEIGEESKRSCCQLPAPFSLGSGCFGLPGVGGSPQPGPAAPAAPAEVDGSRACSLRQPGCDSPGPVPVPAPPPSSAPGHPRARLDAAGLAHKSFSPGFSPEEQPGAGFGMVGMCQGLPKLLCADVWLCPASLDTPTAARPDLRFGGSVWFSLPVLRGNTRNFATACPAPSLPVPNPISALPSVSQVPDEAQQVINKLRDALGNAFPQNPCQGAPWDPCPLRDDERGPSRLSPRSAPAPGGSSQLPLMNR